MMNAYDDFYMKEFGKIYSAPAEEKPQLWANMAAENGPFHKWTL